jgi:hypothetical protein
MVTRSTKAITIGLLLGILLIFANGIYFYYNEDDFGDKISGNSIKEKVGGFYEISSLSQRVFLLFQFLILILIVFVVFIIIKKAKTRRLFSKSEFVHNNKANTDLDTLYSILKYKKEISIDDISKIFKIKSEIALGWAKVLENGDLAAIDYPRFGNPVLRLADEEAEDNSMLKTKEEATPDEKEKIKKAKRLSRNLKKLEKSKAKKAKKMQKAKDKSIKKKIKEVKRRKIVRAKTIKKAKKASQKSIKKR